MLGFDYFLMVNRKVFIELFDWLLISAIVPFVLPLLFAFFVSRFLVTVDVGGLMKLLLSKGVYTFLGLTMLISLFSDYRKVPNAFRLNVYVTIFFSSFITCFIFLSSLEFIPQNVAISFQQNINDFVIASVAIFCISIYLKFKILKTKYSNVYEHI